MKKINCLLFLILMLSCKSNLVNGNNDENKNEDILVPDVIYSPDFKSIFPNPERGFAPAIEPPQPLITWNFCEQEEEKYTDTQWVEPLNIDKLKSYRDEGMSMVMIRYHIAEFRHKPLSEDFLSRLTSDFSVLREAGLKSVLRFVYNWWGGGPDAPLDITLSHIRQLKPLLHDNSDVIAFMDLGFIGCFGEIHNSSNGHLDKTTPSFNSLNNNSVQIIDELLDALPKDRMITLRHPAYKFQYFNGLGLPTYDANKPIAPITEDEAFTGSKKARMGALEDCLVCSEYNCGTWSSPRNNPAEIRNFLNKDNLYVVQSGESGVPCGCDGSDEDVDGDGYTNENRAGCKRVLEMMKFLHWSVLNASFADEALKKWKFEGCYEDIHRSLGYRYRLKDSYVSDEAVDGTIDVLFNITNDGWASCYNPRDLQIVLRNNVTKDVYKLPIDISNRSNDPRFWLPGGTYTVKVKDLKLPDNIKEGEYQVLLNLPDPKETLSERPEYSIRLANIGLWEEETGYNDMQQTLIVR